MWAPSLSADRKANILLFSAMDQIADATYQIEQSVKVALPSILLPPQVRDSFQICHISDNLGLLDPFHLESMFPSVELGQSNLNVFLQELPGEIRTMLFAKVQDTHLKNLVEVRSWQSKPISGPITKHLPKSLMG